MNAEWLAGRWNEAFGVPRGCFFLVFCLYYSPSRLHYSNMALMRLSLCSNVSDFATLMLWLVIVLFSSLVAIHHRIADGARCRSRGAV